MWGVNEYDRLYATLRAYNGGLGWWQQEAILALDASNPSTSSNRRRQLMLLARDNIDAACGKAKRSVKFCPENLNYPRRILNIYQPLYSGWGRVVIGVKRGAA